MQDVDSSAKTLICKSLSLKPGQIHHFSTR